MAASAPSIRQRSTSVTTNDFMRRGGDGYIVFRDNAIDPYDTWAVMADSVVEYIQARGRRRPERHGDGGCLSAGGEGRITKVTPAVQRSRRLQRQPGHLHQRQRSRPPTSAAPRPCGAASTTRCARWCYAPIPICDNVATCIPAYSAVDVAYLYLYMVEGRGFDNWNQSVMEMAAPGDHACGIRPPRPGPARGRRLAATSVRPTAP